MSAVHKITAHKGVDYNGHGQDRANTCDNRRVELGQRRNLWFRHRRVYLRRAARYRKPCDIHSGWTCGTLVYFPAVQGARRASRGRQFISDKNGRLFPKKSEKDVRLQISIVLCRGPGRRLHRRDSVSIPDRRTALNGRDRRAHTGRPHVLQVPDTARLRRQDFAHQQPL